VLGDDGQHLLNFVLADAVDVHGGAEIDQFAAERFHPPPGVEMEPDEKGSDQHGKKAGQENETISQRQVFPPFSVRFCPAAVFHGRI